MRQHDASDEAVCGPELQPRSPVRAHLSTREYGSTISRLLAAWRVAARTARLAIGVPDYETYLDHCQRHHAGERAMSYAEFFRSRQDARYRRGTSRCC